MLYCCCCIEYDCVFDYHLYFLFLVCWFSLYKKRTHSDLFQVTSSPNINSIFTLSLVLKNPSAKSYFIVFSQGGDQIPTFEGGFDYVSKKSWRVVDEAAKGEAKLGNGGFGVVFQVQDTKTGKMAALKVIGMGANPNPDQGEQ